MKPVLCFAWQAEAKPFIELLNAKLIHQQKNIKFYQSNDACILVMGLGIIHTATAIGWLCAQHKHIMLWNIGFCGSEKLPQYSWHRVVKVTYKDQYFYPEIFANSSYPLTDLETVDTAQNSENLKLKPAKIVDMEGYGFVKSAIEFLPTSQIQLLKWVSDNGKEYFNFNTVLPLYIKTATLVLQEIINQTNYLTQIKPVLSNNITTVLDNTAEKLQLTFTQKNQLKNALIFALGYKKLSDINHQTNQLLYSLSKTERKEALSKLLTFLYAV